MNILSQLASSTVCAACGATAPAFRCSKCRTAYYCNPACQRRHFPQHKQSCRAIGIRESRAVRTAALPFHSLRETKITVSNDPCSFGELCCRAHQPDAAITAQIEMRCGHAVCAFCLYMKDKDSSCPICQTPLPFLEYNPCAFGTNCMCRRLGSRAPPAILECSHAVCFECIVEHLNQDNVCPPCPTCRVSMPQFDEFSCRFGSSLLQCARQLSNNSTERSRILEGADYVLTSSLVGVSPSSDELLENRFYLEALSLLIKIYLELGNSDEADKLSRALLKRIEGFHPNNKGYVALHHARALVLEHKGQLVDAERELLPLCKALTQRHGEGNENNSNVDPELKAEVLLKMYQINQALGNGDAARKLAVAIQDDPQLRDYPGIHRPVAEWQLKQQQSPERAFRTLLSAVAHEAPEDVHNRHDNVEALLLLQEQMELARAEREEMETFLRVWGDVADDLKFRDFGKTPQSWSDWRDAFVVEGDMESDDEEEDAQEADQLQQTDETLATALQKALKNDESEGLHTEETETRTHGVSTSNESDDTIEQGGNDGCTENETVERVEAVEGVMLTNYVLKWLKHADARFRGLFAKKVERLMRGERSRTLSKGLDRCESTIYETYLENKSGHRILWTQAADTGILIWYVSSHKKVSRYASLIDNSKKRNARPLADASEVLGFDNAFETGTVLLDPKQHVPLRLYQVPSDEMEQLKDNTEWCPSLHLTPREKEIVETVGTVCVLGRSGTGKTSTISNRIQYDRHFAGSDPNFSQLFIARSGKVCNYVKETVGEVNANSTLLYWTYDKFLSEAEKALGLPRMTDARRRQRMDFRRFEGTFDDGNLGIDVLVVWTSIRSKIKGLGEKVCRLDRRLRDISYDIFERYDKFMKAEKLWDDTDRVSSIIAKLYENEHARLQLKRSRLYVDEVQDFTQAEVAMFFLCCDPGRLFLAGDPAQAVEEGVDFRFEDVRVVAHQMVPDKKFRPEKPKLLRVNFRSHAGVLNLAAGVLELMFKAFPGSAKELPKDEGLFRGPRPALFSNLRDKGLQELVEKQAGAVILAMNDSTVESLRNTLGETATIMSIRDSKGLEFDQVILANFFSDLSQVHQRNWRDIINGKDVCDPILELQLKQLYTAITRCCKRFLLAESSKSVALDTFVKWATHRRTKDNKSGWLLEAQRVESVEETVMTRDEWNARGLLFASRAEAEDDLDETLKWLAKSLAPFKLGGIEANKKRVQLHLQSIQVRKTLSQLKAASGLDSVATDERAVSVLIQSLTEEKMGLGVEAAKLCRALLRVIDDDDEAEKVLISKHVLAHLPVSEKP